MQVERLPETEESVTRVGMFLANTFAKEITFGGLETSALDARKAYDRIWRVLHEGAIWVAVQNDTIIGSVAVEPTELWWNRTRYLQDGWFYVSPAHRNGTAFFHLLKTVEDYAEKEGLPLVIGVVHSRSVKPLEKSFGRRGYEMVSAGFMKEN